MAFTAATITDKRAVRCAVLAAREAGHALVDQEAEAGFRSLAVPIRRYDGMVTAAMNVGLHVERASVETLRAVHLPRLLAVADEIRSQLI
jgi:IclR family pca regulon transcriptional regulator